MASFLLGTLGEDEGRWRRSSEGPASGPEGSFRPRPQGRGEKRLIKAIIIGYCCWRGGGGRRRTQLLRALVV